MLDHFFLNTHTLAWIGFAPHMNYSRSSSSGSIKRTKKKHIEKSKNAGKAKTTKLFPHMKGNWRARAHKICVAVRFYLHKYIFQCANNRISGRVHVCVGARARQYFFHHHQHHCRGRCCRSFSSQLAHFSIYWIYV